MSKKTDKKDLTTSHVDRVSILNNDFAVKKVQKYIGLGGISFEGSYRFTKQQIVDYYGVDNRTLERYLKKYSVELREN
jgi:hypothetical protein